MTEVIGCCREFLSSALLDEVVRRPVIASSSALMDYLCFELRSETNERFRSLYLNARHELLAQETSKGTIDAVPFVPREIIGRALELGATSIIIAHNHPSGDPKPSPRDLECTRLLAQLCHGMDISFLDHVIVGRGSFVSLRREGAIA